jgi:hypothetical protein
MSLPTADVRGQWAAHNPGLDTSPMELIGLLKRITALLDRAVEPLYEGAPLTAPEVDMLIPLRHATEPAIARRLAQQMDWRNAASSSEPPTPPTDARHWSPSHRQARRPSTTCSPGNWPRRWSCWQDSGRTGSGSWGRWGGWRG